MGWTIESGGEFLQMEVLALVLHYDSRAEVVYVALGKHHLIPSPHRSKLGL